MEAIIFLGHGNRSPVGRTKYLKFIESTMSKIKNVPIKEYCYFERAEPTLTDAVNNCIQQGATSILVIPVLLLPGKQTTEEIPSDLKSILEKFPEVTITFGEPIGADPLMLQIVNDRLETQSFSAKNNEAVVLVSHGSHDPLAAKEFRYLATVLSTKLEAKVETCYLVTSPNYLEVTRGLLNEGYEKIYVIPYFLFAGMFLQEMKESTEKEDHVVICDELGYDEKLIQLLVERATRRENSGLPI